MTNEVEYRGIQIEHRGFEMDSHAVEYLRDKIAELMEYCPDDSQAEIKIAKIHERFHSVARVHHAGGSLTAESEATTLSDGMRDLMDDLYNEIHAWRKYRDIADATEQHDTTDSPNDSASGNQDDEDYTVVS